MFAQNTGHPHKMSHALTAQDLFSEMMRMPATERVKFFSLLSTNAFRDDDFSHEQVFGHLERESLSAWEAAEYLELSLPTLRCHVQADKLRPSPPSVAIKCSRQMACVHISVLASKSKYCSRLSTLLTVSAPETRSSYRCTRGKYWTLFDN